MTKRKMTLVGGMALLLLVLVSGTASANPIIVGAVGFNGQFTLNVGTDFTGAQTITFTNVTATQGAGSFTPMIGTSVAMNPVTYSPVTVPVNTQWTDNVSGTVFSFDLTSFVVTLKTSTDLVLNGTGTAHITNYADTQGVWTISANSFGTGSMTFSGSTAMVPEPGTVVLLGLGLLGLGVISRKRIK